MMQLSRLTWYFFNPSQRGVLLPVAGHVWPKSPLGVSVDVCGYLPQQETQ